MSQSVNPQSLIPDAFYWHAESWGWSLRCRPLDAIAPHLFTTRQLQLRGEPDAWRALASSVGVAESAVVRLRQVHGSVVVAIHRGEPRSSFETPPDADAIISNDPECAIVVQAADCVPLLLADPTTGVVGAVHAGWRGTAAGAAGAAVKRLQDDFGVRPADLVAAIGPSIGPCCYEVGEELVDAFAAAGHERAQIDRWFVTGASSGGSEAPLDGRSPRRHLDLWAANRDQLVVAGLHAAHVHVCGLCTASNLDVLYSYRAEGAATGRLAAAIKPGRG